MSYSLNEIEALAKRAARGAGLSWGLSEESAKACRWLASHDLPGVALLADVLTRNDKVPYSHVAPVSLDGIWQAPSGTLCPLASGAALNDCADRLLPGQGIEMSNLTSPLLMVPFAAWAALHIGAPVTVSWLDSQIVTDGYKIWIDDPKSEIEVSAAVALTCCRATHMDDRATAPAQRGSVDQPAWARLGVFAHRTYAPATPQSRRFGAGAGATDND
ncbi:DUF3726 domain-containing protein [Aliiroseovarius sp. S1339]|uniref:DUF3726 domain-containing protein n=1 Tax=Aliiroseovarius sp. S1339 TaxID=2936990 RepID=UPI0020C02883|nr:DUF3726 domain-containing protein [Aliiroseovarius sp. S1339]MCK8463144.1 DUF3726 domain-containing protein [Aliiroseovarius sp. S1339]